MSSVQITCKNIVYYIHFQILRTKEEGAKYYSSKKYMYNKTKRKFLKLCILGQPWVQRRNPIL